jgi:hypothetical protein
LDNIKLDLKKYNVKPWTRSAGSGEGLMAGSCEHDNEPSGSIKDRISSPAELSVCREEFYSMEFVTSEVMFENQ